MTGRDWLKRVENPLWKDARTIHPVTDRDVLMEAARVVREMGHSLAAVVLERWAEQRKP